VPWAFSFLWLEKAKRKLSRNQTHAASPNRPMSESEKQEDRKRVKVALSSSCFPDFLISK
jgi:hypothetical protein